MEKPEANAIAAYIVDSLIMFDVLGSSKKKEAIVALEQFILPLEDSNKVYKNTYGKTKL